METKYLLWALQQKFWLLLNKGEVMFKLYDAIKDKEKL